MWRGSSRSWPYKHGVAKAQTFRKAFREKHLHGQLDIAFDEDRCRTRKEFPLLNLAGVRPTVLNILKRDKAKLSLARNRLKASVNPTFRAALLAYLQI
jgi:hypothetical protein